MAKTMNKNAKTVSLAEEAAAAKAEQKRPTKPISVSGLKKVQRVHEIKKILAPYEAEIAEIKAQIFLEMDNKGVDVLTRKGVEIVSRDEVEAEVWDKKSIKAKFPEVVVQFVVERVSFRVNWKNPFDA